VRGEKSRADLVTPTSFVLTQGAKESEGRKAASSQGRAERTQATGGETTELRKSDGAGLRPRANAVGGLYTTGLQF
jgi:hypothetical protein